MMLIGQSTCKCNKCHSTFGATWEIESSNTTDHDHGMGEETEYLCTLETTCPECGAEISASMTVCEYPVGCLVPISHINVTPGTAKISIPRVDFFDL